MKTFYSLCCILSAIGFAVSSNAQDLNSELDLKPQARWTKVIGLAPNILECRLSEKGHLQCVTDEDLRNVTCESTHFAKLSEVRALFKGRAFSCEGTRYDINTALTQWTVVLNSERGAESRWKIEGADQTQLRRLYELELKTVDQQTDAHLHYYSLAFLGRIEDLGSTSRMAGAINFEYAVNNVLFSTQYAQISGSEIKERSRFRVGLGYALETSRIGSGWLFKADTGHLVLSPDNRVWAHCLGPEYRWNPGTWKFMTNVANCWHQGGNISFSPAAEIRVAKRLASTLYLLASGQVHAPQGTWGGRKTRVSSHAQLGVSFSILP